MSSLNSLKLTDGSQNVKCLSCNAVFNINKEYIVSYTTLDPFIDSDETQLHYIKKILSSVNILATLAIIGFAASIVTIVLYFLA